MTSSAFEGFDLKRERDRLAGSLYAAMSELDEAAGADRLLASFAELLIRATPHFRLAWFYLGDPQAEELRPDYCAGPERAYGESLVIDRSAVMMRGPVRRALGGGTPVVQNIPAELTSLQRFLPGVVRWHRAAIDAGVRAVLALPFPLLSRREWGLTVVYADREGYFDDVGLEPFKALGRLVQVGLDRVALRAAEQRSREDLQRVRVEDRLTGLANREGFEASLGRLRADGAERVVLQLNVDDFSALNASGGSDLGDAVLGLVAGRLKALARGGLAARISGDEFFLAARLQDLAATPEGFAEHCQHELSRPMVAAGRHLSLSVSVGVSVLRPGVPGGVADALREAGVALAVARQSGPGGRQRYRPELEQGGVAPQGLIADLRVALTEAQLELWYQPQVALGRDEGRLVGAEALLRWRRAGGELTAPGSFIPAAEGSPLIRDLGRWVLGQALESWLEWGAVGPPAIGVNIGARHLLDPRFIEDVEALLQRFPALPPGALAIEITETAAMADVERTRGVLNRLRELGISVALDDFGTGHASLAHLRAIPVDELKMDRGFVSGIDGDSRLFAIAEGLLATARGLGLGVVAEGVENAREAAVMTGLGCRVAQGYGFARPMPAAEIAAWSRKRGRLAGHSRVPVGHPVITALEFLAVALAGAGEARSLPPEVLPLWFREWLAESPSTAEPLAALTDALPRAQHSRADLDAAWRALATLRPAVYARVSSNWVSRTGPISSAGDGRQ